jgi:hypothetical protein
MHKYVKIGKEMEKGKRKGFPLLAVPGGNSTQQGGTRGRAGRRPTWPASGGNGAGTAPWAQAHVPARRGGDSLTGGDGGPNRSELDRR